MLFICPNPLLGQVLLYLPHYTCAIYSASDWWWILVAAARPTYRPMPGVKQLSLHRLCIIHRLCINTSLHPALLWSADVTNLYTLIGECLATEKWCWHDLGEKVNKPTRLDRQFFFFISWCTVQCSGSKICCKRRHFRVKVFPFIGFVLTENSTKINSIPSLTLHNVYRSITEFVK